MIALELVIKILAGIAVGFLFFKSGIFSTKTNVSLSRALGEIICPFMILANILSISGTQVIGKEEVFRVLLIGVVIYAVLIPLSAWITRLLKVGRFSSGAFQSLLVFGNVGFLGLPVAESLYGAEGVFYMALLNIHFNLLCYTYGLWLVTRETDNGYHFSAKKIINPGIICVVIAVIIFLLDIRLPELAISPFRFIGNLTSPLSMLILGSSIASHPLKNVFTNWRLYVISAVRMIGFPIVTFFLMKLLFGPGMLTNIVTLYLGMPTALLASVFAMAYGGDEETATSGAAMMNIFCIATIPGITLMTGYL